MDLKAPVRDLTHPGLRWGVNLWCGEFYCLVCGGSPWTEGRSLDGPTRSGSERSSPGFCSSGIVIAWRPLLRVVMKNGETGEVMSHRPIPPILHAPDSPSKLGPVDIGSRDDSPWPVPCLQGERGGTSPGKSTDPPSSPARLRSLPRYQSATPEVGPQLDQPRSSGGGSTLNPGQVGNFPGQKSSTQSLLSGQI